MRKRTSILRGAVAYAAGASLVYLGVEAGNTSVPEARAAAPAAYWSEGEMPGFPGGLEYPLGEGMAVNGVPLRMSYFEAKVDAETLRQHYADALEARGLEVHVMPGVGGGWNVTAISEDGRSEIVVAILGQGPKMSLVFPSIVPLGATASDAQELLDDLPLSPAATGALTVTSSDRPGEAIITYHEPNEPAGATATFIRDDMGRRGWELREFSRPGDKRPQWIVEGRHAGRQGRFGIMPWPKSDTGATITVELSAAGSAQDSP